MSERYILHGSRKHLTCFRIHLKTCLSFIAMSTGIVCCFELNIVTVFLKMSRLSDGHGIPILLLCIVTCCISQETPYTCPVVIR